jgi:anti-anti-sigma factor
MDASDATTTGTVFNNAMDLPLTYVVFDEEALVVLSRPLDSATAPAVHEVFEAAIADGARRIVVDLSEVSIVDEGGVAVLAAAIASLASRDGRLVIALADGQATEFSDPQALRAALDS